MRRYDVCSKVSSLDSVSRADSIQVNAGSFGSSGARCSWRPAVVRTSTVDWSKLNRPSNRRRAIGGQYVYVSPLTARAVPRSGARFGFDTGLCDFALFVVRLLVCYLRVRA